MSQKSFFLRVLTDMGCSGDGESGVSEDEDEDNISVVWEDPEMAGDSGGVMVVARIMKLLWK
jgi:hypothetical protein